MIQDICNAKKSTDTNAEVHLPVNTVGYIRALPWMDLSLSHLEVASKILQQETIKFAVRATEHTRRHTLSISMIFSGTQASPAPINCPQTSLLVKTQPTSPQLGTTADKNEKHHREVVGECKVCRVKVCKENTRKMRGRKYRYLKHDSA